MKVSFRWCRIALGRPARAAFALALAAVAGCSQHGEPASGATGGQAEGAAASDDATEGAPAGRLTGAVRPTRYALDLRIDPREDAFSGHVTIDIELAEPRQRIWLHGLGLEVGEAYAVAPGGQRIEATYTQALDSGVASLTLERALAAGGATLDIEYTAPFNRSVNALFRADRGDASYVASQLEPVAGRQIFPGFDDPQFKTPWDVTLTTRADDVAVTNTAEIGATELDDGWVRHRFATSKPLPSYLLAFAVGPYDVVEADPIPATALRSRPVPLRGIAARGQGAKFGISLAETPAIVTWLEAYFDTPYPYDKLDLIAMPADFGGAMENPGAITYDEFLILLGEDPPLSQRRVYMNVHAHELAHLWFGDLVTPDWWTDIWLNESFASWMANKAAEAVWPEGEFARATLDDALGAMAEDSFVATRRIRENVARNEEIEDAFDGITYEKGGGVLDMFESYLGEDAFRAGVRLHMRRFADDVADADDFMQSLAEGSGQPAIVDSFRSFIDQAGVPVVDARLECAEDSAPSIELRQRRYAPLGSTIDTAAQQWEIPVCVAYETDAAPGRFCEMLDTPAATFDLDLDECPSAIHPNSEGAGYYRFTLDDAGWAALIERAPALGAAEALTLVDSLDAAFRAGSVSAERLVAGLVALAGHPAWDVAAATVDKFAALLDVVPYEQREVVAANLVAVYRPRYDALSGASDESSALLRRRLVAFLAHDAVDPEIRGELERQAAAYLGLETEADTDVVAADQLPTVLRTGIEGLGVTFFDRLLEVALESEDPYFRQSAYDALGTTARPVPSAELRAGILARRFPLQNSLQLIMGQLGGDLTREPTWDWIRENAAEVIAIVPEFFRTQAVPRFGAGFCSVERAAELEEFVVSHADQLPGYERSLAQVTEQIMLCAALREAKADELAAALAAL